MAKIWWPVEECNEGTPFNSSSSSCRRWNLFNIKYQTDDFTLKVHRHPSSQWHRLLEGVSGGRCNKTIYTQQFMQTSPNELVGLLLEMVGDIMKREWFGIGVNIFIILPDITSSTGPRLHTYYAWSIYELCWSFEIVCCLGSLVTSLCRQPPAKTRVRSLSILYFNRRCRGVLLVNFPIQRPAIASRPARS